MSRSVNLNLCIVWFPSVGPLELMTIGRAAQGKRRTYHSPSPLQLSPLQLVHTLSCQLEPFSTICIPGASQPRCSVHSCRAETVSE